MLYYTTLAKMYTLNSFIIQNIDSYQSLHFLLNKNIRLNSKEQSKDYHRAQLCLAKHKYHSFFKNYLLYQSIDGLQDNNLLAETNFVD